MDVDDEQATAVEPLTASEAAGRGLAIFAHLGLESDSITELAESIVAGTADDETLAAALTSWPLKADRNPKHAGLAWLLTGGSATRAKEKETLSFDLSASDRPELASPGSSLAAVLVKLSDDMNRIQRIARASIQSTMDLATISAADRIGRAATQKVANADVKARCRDTDPRLAVARMGRVVFAALNLDEQERVKSALTEGLKVVEQTLTDRTNEVLSTFSREFAVDHEPNPYAEAIPAALDYLSSAAADWVIEKLHDPDANAPDRFPSDIIITTLQVAGGNDTPTSHLPARQGGLQPSLTFGPTFSLLLADTITAYRETDDEPAPTTAVARRQPGALISTELGEELAAVADLLDGDDLPLEPVRRWIHSGSDTPFEPHSDLDGRVFETDADYQLEASWSSGDFPFVDVLAPGDHGGCGCELEVTARLDLVNLQRRRDSA